MGPDDRDWKNKLVEAIEHGPILVHGRLIQKGTRGAAK